MPNNSISIDGNNNLVIQGVEGSQVYINSDEGVQRLLQEQGDKIEQILQSLESQPSALSQQWAEKIYNIQQAGPIHFHIYGERKIPKILIPAGAEVPASFLGRETEKNKIWQLLFLRSRSLALVNAEGGMGKTTLAAYYWQQYAKEYQHLAWLYCESGIVNAMLNQLPTALGILDDINAALKQAAHTGQNLQDAQWQTLKRALSNLKAPCLLVLDNANNPADIRFFLQQSKGLNWHILLTSRCAGVMADAQSEYRITGLPPDLAKQLFTSNYTEPGLEFEALLERFLKAIGYNTLCIEIFSKNLKANEGWGDLTMAGLLAKLETQSLYLGEASFAINSDWGNPANVRSSDDIIAALYDIVALGQARPTLHQTLATLALLPAEQHPAAVLRQLLPAESPAALKKQLDELQSLGWLAATEGAYRISPVVQKMVLQELSPEQRWVLGEPLVQRLQVVFEAEGYHPKNIATAAPFAELVEGLAANLGLANEDLILLFDRLWVYYKATGKLAQALVCAGQMGELCREVGDKNGMASSYTNLGETHRSLGNLKQTLTFFQENLGLTKELYEDFPDNVEFKKRLASSHQFLGITHNTLGNLR